MPLCVILHGYRCGVETLILEVFSLLIYFIEIRVVRAKGCNLKVSVFTQRREVFVDIEQILSISRKGCRHRVVCFDFSFCSSIFVTGGRYC